MCLIIKSDNASELKQNLLTSAYHNNSDGFGGLGPELIKLKLSA